MLMTVSHAALLILLLATLACLLAGLLERRLMAPLARLALEANTKLAKEIHQRAQTEELLAERTERLEAVQVVTGEITRELDLTVLLQVITRRAVELVCGTAMKLWKGVLCAYAR